MINTTYAELVAAPARPETPAVVPDPGAGLRPGLAPDFGVPPGPPPPSPGSALPPPPCFPRLPGETPRAFSAFLAFFQLGHGRSLPAVADKLGEGLGTVKNWSCKHDWAGRLQAFHSGLLEQQVRDQAALQLQPVVDWAHRLNHFREQEWDSAQKLIAAAQCFLETFGEEDLHKMTLAQASRALKISSAIGRSALGGAELPKSSDPVMSPLQEQLLAAVTRVYGRPDSTPVGTDNPASVLVSKQPSLNPAL